MTAQTPPPSARADGTNSATVEQLRAREAALRQQAAQLEARAEHLQRVRRAQVQQLLRRVDTHEKIVLGALVKKSGLDLLSSGSTGRDRHQQQNDNDAPSSRRGIAAQSSLYDRELILGALIWLAWLLKQPANSTVSVPEQQRLRDDGSKALGRFAAPPWPPAPQH